jgi:hypothetical protein
MTSAGRASRCWCTARPGRGTAGRRTTITAIVRSPLVGDDLGLPPGGLSAAASGAGDHGLGDIGVRAHPRLLELGTQTSSLKRSSAVTSAPEHGVVRFLTPYFRWSRPSEPASVRGFPACPGCARRRPASGTTGRAGRPSPPGTASAAPDSRNRWRRSSPSPGRTGPRSAAGSPRAAASWWPAVGFCPRSPTDPCRRPRPLLVVHLASRTPQGPIRPRRRPRRTPRGAQCCRSSIMIARRPRVADRCPRGTRRWANR